MIKIYSLRLIALSLRRFAVKTNPAKCALLTTVIFYITVSLVYLPRPTLACYYGKYNESVPFEL